MKFLTDFENADETQALKLNDSQIPGPDFQVTALPPSPLDPHDLWKMSEEELRRAIADEVTVLEMLSREGQRRIRTRLLVLFQRDVATF